MKKFLPCFLLLAFILVPNSVLASGIDQYGWFININGQESYTVIPDYPNYYSGYCAKPMSPYIFYQPEVASERLADKSVALVTPQLTINPDQDEIFCQEVQLFAEGRYTADNKVRIKPVCAAKADEVMVNDRINKSAYYTNLPVFYADDITKVYHYEEYLNKKIFTDRPELEDLKNHIIQGATDPAMYYVDKINGVLTLRKIFEDKAQAMFGSEYKDKVIYFSDAIVYSFQLGASIW